MKNGKKDRGAYWHRVACVALATIGFESVLLVTLFLVATRI